MMGGYTRHRLLDTRSLKDIKPGEMKESGVEGFEGEKILVVNHDSQVFGLSTKCTHYGAPLAKGILSRDGKITCPWHGSCFNARTGDIEDAPALDDLKVYKIVEREGSLFMQIEDGDKHPFEVNGVCRYLGREVTEPQEHTIIIGAGSGAMGCLETLVRKKYPGRISVISAPDQELPIDRTKLSKALPMEEKPLHLRSEDWFRRNNIEFGWGRVQAVDFGSRVIKTEHGQVDAYTKLVIATGGKPKYMPLPGLDSPENVLVLRTMSDVRRIGSAIEGEEKKITIIGSSFIGLEVANALSNKGHDVTVIGQTATALGQVLGDQIGGIIQEMLEKRGIHFIMGASVSHLARDDDFPGTKFIYLHEGKGFIAADTVILAVGITPVTDFIAEGGVGLLRDRSVLVDHHFRLQGIDGVYAVGDIATFPYWGPGTGMRHENIYTRIEHWDVAQNAGRAVGEHIAFIKANPRCEKPPKEFVPVFWSALGQQLRYCGNTLNGYDDVIIRHEKPDEDTTKFVAFYMLDQTVVAVASMNWDPIVMKCVNLMKARKMPMKVDLQRGLNIMDLPV